MHELHTLQNCQSDLISFIRRLPLSSETYHWFAKVLAKLRGLDESSLARLQILSERIWVWQGRLI